MYRGAPPIDATESTRNKQSYLWEQITTYLACGLIYVTDMIVRLAGNISLVAQLPNAV